MKRIPFWCRPNQLRERGNTSFSNVSRMLEALFSNGDSAGIQDPRSTHIGGSALRAGDVAEAFTPN